MSRLSECHQKLTNGAGNCSVPMWCGGMPDGFCNEPAYSNPVRKIGNWENGKFIEQYIPALACRNHGGLDFPPEMSLKIDGNMWCATYKDFINLQESIAGFGETKDEAIAELIKLKSPKR